MPRSWVETIIADPAQVSQLANTKEDSEVLKGLFIGRYMYEQFHDEHIVKRAKTIDTI